MNTDSRIDSASRVIAASPERIYRAFAEPGAMERWLPPSNMTGTMLHFDFREGGSYRMRLTYTEPHQGGGKTSEDSDEAEVRLTKLDAARRIEQEIRFESDDPAFAGTMRMIWTFDPRGEKTLVTIRAENVPVGIRPDEHQVGLRSSLENLARFVEARFVEARFVEAGVVDPSNGYEGIADAFIARRGTRPRTGDAIGASTIRAWAQSLPAGAAVLDLGSGPGEPTTRILHEAGLIVHAVDASPTMVAALCARFPDVRVECNIVEASTFFDRKFDGVLAWGLLFLLTAEAQAHVIAKVGRALVPGGRFLFTAPKDAVEWNDVMTGLRSRSLGGERYHQLLRNSGMECVAEADDAGENHYYFAEQLRS